MSKIDETVRKIEMAEILDIVEENAKVKTFVVNGDSKNAMAGQFAMLWLPRVDEKPFTYSWLGEKTAFSVAKTGPFTLKMHELRIGDKIGIRGPFGKGFKIKGNEIALVAGGYGAAPMACLGEKLLLSGKKVHYIIGARTANELLFSERMRKAGANLIECTDDGTRGEKGFTTVMLEKLLTENTSRIDYIYTCGPEMMMKRVFEISEKQGIGCQASLERWIKCGFGICGQCVVDGYRICSDGPVFDGAKLRKMKEFGRVVRDAAGAIKR